MALYWDLQNGIIGFWWCGTYFLGDRDCGRIAGLLPRDGSYLLSEDPLWISWEVRVAERKEAWLGLY